MKKRSNSLFLMAFIVAILLIIAVNVISNKNNYGMEGDEVFSYISATSEGGFRGVCFLEDQTWYDADYFSNALTATGSERFNIGMVVENQAMDTHPPLYYIFLNFVCSILEGKFSQWYGIGLNIFFMIGVEIGLFLLLDYFIKNRYASLFLSTAFCCSFLAINMVLFIRMYVLLMAIVLFQSWYHLKLYDWMKESEDFSIKRNWKKYGVLLFLTIIGGMTHYYFLVYQCLISALFVLACWQLKRYKDILRYVGIMICSAVIYVVLYPASLTHMFFKYRGQEAVHKFLKESTLADEVYSMFKAFSNQLYKGMLAWILLILIVVTGILLWKKRLSYKEMIRLMIVGLPAFIYFVGIAKASQFVSVRYISPVAALIYAVLVIWAWYLLKALNLKGGFCVGGIVVLLSTVFLSVVYFFNVPIKSEYFAERKALVEEVANETDYCVYITGDEYNWKMWEDYINYPVFDGLFFIDGQQKNAITDEKLLKQQKLLFYVDKALDLDDVYGYLQEYLPLNNFEVKYETSYTYIIY